MVTEGRIRKSILIIVMNNKLIFENWRKFITEEEKLSNLTPKEKKDLEAAVKQMKAHILGVLAANLHENLEEGRPGSKARRRRNRAQRRAKTQEVIKSLMNNEIIDEDDLKTKYEDLDPEEKKAYKKALKDERAAGIANLFTGNLLDELPWIGPGSPLHNFLTSLAGDRQINLTTIMSSPLAELFGIFT